jgi:hypothetical protein
MNNCNRLNRLREKTDKEYFDALKRHASLTSFINEADRRGPIPRDILLGGYCASSSMEFHHEDYPISELLEAYPPESLMCLKKSIYTQVSVKPISYIREGEQEDDHLPASKLLFEHNEIGHTTLYWWTNMAGQHVQINVRKAPWSAYLKLVWTDQYAHEQIQSAKRQITFGIRKLSTPAVRTASIDAWMREWDLFSAEETYDKSQWDFFGAIQWQILNHPDYTAMSSWQSQGLPPVTRKRIFKKEHWMDEIGNFWDVFSQDSAERMWKFCLRMAERWPTVEAEHERELDLVTKALLELLENSSTPYTKDTMRYIQHAVAVKTGLLVHHMQFYVPMSGIPSVEFGLTEQSWGPRRKVAFSANGASRLKPQDITVSYIE